MIDNIISIGISMYTVLVFYRLHFVRSKRCNSGAVAILVVLILLLTGSYLIFNNILSYVSDYDWHF